MRQREVLAKQDGTTSPSSRADGPSGSPDGSRECREHRTRSSAKVLQPFSELENVATAKVRWRKWLGQLEHFFIVTGETDTTVKRSQMLLQGGDELTDLLGDLPDTGDDYEQAVAAPNKHFDPQFNADYEHFQFRQATDESLDMFYSRLRRLICSCVGVNKQFELRSQIINVCRSVELRKLITLQLSMDLEAILKVGRSHELAASRATSMVEVLAKKEEGPRAVSPTQVKEERTEKVKAARVVRDRNDRGGAFGEKGSRCINCGRESHGKDNCPARGKQCLKCASIGHFARMC